MDSCAVNNAVSDLNIKVLFKIFIKDKVMYSNVIIDIMKELEFANDKRTKKALAILSKIFCYLMKEGDLKQSKCVVADNIMNAKQKYGLWLYNKYENLYDQLLLLLRHTNFQVQMTSLHVIMRLMQTEMIHPVTEENIYKISFPVQKLKNMLAILLSELCDNRQLIKCLQEYLEFPDFLLICLSSLSDIVMTKSRSHDNPVYTENIFALLQLIDLPLETGKPLEAPKLFKNCGHATSVAGENSEKKSLQFNFPYKEAQTLFNNIWETFLNFELSTDLYKKCLVLIPMKVIMHLDHPVRLADFFISAYNIGSTCSLLAMHGVFVLVNQYNLEYPDFYDKVYALLQPSIFQAKYKAQFFVLCDKFLSSTLLPEYIVAAFIKRLSRLMLVAPSSSLVLLLKFVANLLVKYPSLQRLITNPNATCIEDDPYIMDEPKTQLCRAGESSLWEVATLRHHSLCGISKAANFLHRNLPDVEHDLFKFVHDSYEDLLRRASKIQEPRVFTNIYEPSGLFSYKDDDMSVCWSVF